MSWLLPLLAVPGIGQATELAIDFEKYELDNGLDVILAPDASTPIVSVNVWYHVGSKDEAPGLSGFAHLFEHLMFQGSASQPSDYFTPLDNVGASANGSTTADRTNYHETLPAQYLPLALFVESDRMGWLVIDSHKLDNQREVVKNERRQRYENPPYGTARLDLYQALYPKGHPYHHSTIGSHTDLGNAALEDVQGFFDTWYVPNNASLVVTGDFEPESTKALIAEYFGDIPAGEPITRSEPPPHALTNRITLRQFQSVPEQRVWLAWHSPAVLTEGDAALDLLSEALSGGKASRLYQRLVQTGIAKEVDAYQASRLLASAYVVTATAAPGHDTDEIVAIIDEVVAEVTHDKPPTEDEISAAQANFEHSLYQGLTTIQAKADALNRYNYFAGDPAALFAEMARYERDPEAVRAAAAEVFSGQRVELHIWPEADNPQKAKLFWQKLFKKKSASDQEALR